MAIFCAATYFCKFIFIVDFIVELMLVFSAGMRRGVKKFEEFPTSNRLYNRGIIYLKSFTHTLSLVHTWPFESVESCRKTQEIKDSNSESLSLGSFCATLTTQTT